MSPTSKGEEPQLSREEEIRSPLQRIIEGLEGPYFWHTGEVELELESGEVIAGMLQDLEPAAAIIDGSRGLESVLIKDVRSLRAWIASPGPE